MKPNIYILFLFIILSNSLVSQNYIEYYNNANEAEYLLNIGKTKEAKSILLKLNKRYKKLKPKDNFYLAVCYYLDNDSISGLNYFKKSINSYMFVVDELKHIKRTIPSFIISANHINTLNNIEDSIATIIKTLINKSVVDSIDFYFNQDLLNRTEDVVIDQNLDISIQTNFLNYLTKNGIPNIYIYGEQYSGIFIHVYDDALLKKYEVFLLDQIKQGNICPYHLSTMVDRKLYFDSQSTKYGSYINPKTIDKIKINQSRKKIGLSIYYNGSCFFPIFKKSNRN